MGLHFLRFTLKMFSLHILRGKVTEWLDCQQSLFCLKIRRENAENVCSPRGGLSAALNPEATGLGSSQFTSSITLIVVERVYCILIRAYSQL